jgi:hypothetical protein
VLWESWGKVSIEDHSIFCGGKCVRKWAGSGSRRLGRGRRRGWGRGNKGLGDSRRGGGVRRSSTTAASYRGEGERDKGWKIVCRLDRVLRRGRRGKGGNGWGRLEAYGLWRHSSRFGGGRRGCPLPEGIVVCRGHPFFRGVTHPFAESEVFRDESILFIRGGSVIASSGQFIECPDYSLESGVARCVGKVGAPLQCDRLELFSAGIGRGFPGAGFEGRSRHKISEGVMTVWAS